MHKAISHVNSAFVSSTDIRVMAADYRLSLEVENKSVPTIEIYGSALERFAEWLEARARPIDVRQIRRADVEGFIVQLLTTRAPATAHNRFRALKTFFTRLEAEEEIERSPMAKMSPPEVPEQPVEIVTEEEMRRLLKVCEGMDFASRRDTAMIRLFYDTGIWRNELADLKVETPRNRGASG